jgi:hypothetical protein
MHIKLKNTKQRKTWKSQKLNPQRKILLNLNMN